MSGRVVVCMCVCVFCLCTYRHLEDFEFLGSALCLLGACLCVYVHMCMLGEW